MPAVAAAALLLAYIPFYAATQTCPDVQHLVKELAETKAKLQRFRELEGRPRHNTPWVNALHEAEVRDRTAGRDEDSDDVKMALLRNRRAAFPEGHHLDAWEAHLDQSTPSPFKHANGTVEAWPAGINCRDIQQVVVSERELSSGRFTDSTAARAARLLRECGFVYLDNFFPRKVVAQLREAFEAFKKTPLAQDFVYPVQGAERVEYMLPFAPPFNDTYIHDTRLMKILEGFLGGRFKMELQTIINSLTGSDNQRWHQGWRYLFHPEERLPPYAAVVTMPLCDVTDQMGPTEICPGKKLRFYRGWSCPEGPLRAGTTEGTVVIFDYKTLHRGGANAASRDRPMLSLVYSRSFFLNGEAIVNRALPLVQTLHQRRYWEAYFWHPGDLSTQRAV